MTRGKNSLGKLSLYTVFHGNLNYSSIPKESYHDVIDLCYWPILHAIRNYGLRAGIEFPINTLETINKIDPLFIEEFKKLIKEKKCEFIFSGREQIVSPLVPEEINKENFQYNFRKKFRDISKGNIAYVHEQIFSNGLVPLYLDSGFKNIMIIYETAMDKNNISDIDFFPKKIKTIDKKINVIWNSRTTYQIFQKYIHGKISKKAYTKYVLKNKSAKNSCFPLYGSDMEIFGINNPVLGLTRKGNEVKRFYEIIEEFRDMDGVEFLLPSEILKKFPAKNEIKTCTDKNPILGKKEESIVTRWATCGRDNSRSNSFCYQAFKKINILKNLQDKDSCSNEDLLRLIDCWASDFRTHTEEGKFELFNRNINSLNHDLDKKICKVHNKKILGKNSDITIFNHAKTDWNKIPIEIKLQFKPRFIKNGFTVYQKNKKISSQIENIKFYKDGFIKSLTLVLMPRIPKKSKISIRLIKNNFSTKIEKTETNTVKTRNVEISLSNNSGIINYLAFPKINKKAIIDIKNISKIKKSKMDNLLPNQIFVETKNKKKFFDFQKTNIIFNDYPIRKKFSSETKLPVMDIKKEVYVYEDIPRIDIKYVFNFKEFRPSIFRMNLINIDSNRFDKKFFGYSTHNGGKLETFPIENTITHDKPINNKISSSGCVGATNCTLDIGDRDYGVTIFSDKSITYSASMINSVKSYRNTTRIMNTICESDDTTMIQWKGRKEISYSIFGRKNNHKLIQKTCENMFLGLIFSSNNSNIMINGQK